MTFVEERLRHIESMYAHLIRNFLVLQLTEETFRLVLILNDGTSLRVEERLYCGRLLQQRSGPLKRVVDALFQAVESKASPVRVHHQAKRRV